jgi:hypothetical protein
MGYRLVPLIVLAFAAGACGKEIGDSCNISTDCDPNGTRICDPPGSSKDGYCTIQGCDYSTCPDEAVCVQFFTGSFSKPCDPVCDSVYNPLNPACPAPVSPNVQCSLDELCAISDQCVPRSSEIRFCMRKCDSDGDCRDGYECRDVAQMKADGGEPVFAPGQVIDDQGRVVDPTQKDASGNLTLKVIASHPPKFCAIRPVVSTP